MFFLKIFAKIRHMKFLGDIFKYVKYHICIYNIIYIYIHTCTHIMHVQNTNIL